MEKSGSLDHKILTAKLEALRSELRDVRDASLAANRVGDYMKVARLTARTQKINGNIFEVESAIHALMRIT